tara:strand:- start:2060 stop:3046 length:987 start_codon:yes stop_codon:yes gene_type:complete
MKNKPLLIVSGEPYSIFLEIFFKIYNSKLIKYYNRPIILIASKNLLKMQMKKMRFFFKINEIKKNDLQKISINNKKINIIDVNLNLKKPFGKISSKSSKYIDKCFNTSLDLIKKKKAFAMINGPVSKKYFLKKKFLGITEYLAHKTKNKNNEVMLIYNKTLSVSPITTHTPLKDVTKQISKKSIIKKIITINQFYKKKLNKLARFAITCLNPHCESSSNKNEDDKIIKPAVKLLRKKNIKIEGPFPADTLFIKNNIKKFDVVIGMYHDQILTPMKTLFGFNAINITLGLPFIRVSPDHGPNNRMLGQKKSNPDSLKKSLIFLRKLNEN